MPEVLRNSSRNLILLRAGDASLHGTWLGDSIAQRQWDMHISYFGSKGGPQPCDEAISVSHDFQKNKWPGLAAALESNQFSLDDYDYVALPDDDLISTVDDWNRAFQIAREYDLGACQLSLDQASFVGFLWTVKRPFLKLRYTSTIEFMAPVVRTDVLRKIIPYLTAENNVWAMDHIVTHLLGDVPRSMAVLDAATVLHTRAFFTGPLYDHVREAGLTPEQARSAFLEEHGIEQKPSIGYGAITKDGRAIERSGLAEALILYSRFVNWYRRGKGHLRIATAENGAVAVLRRFGFAPSLSVDYATVSRRQPGSVSRWIPQRLRTMLKRTQNVEPSTHRNRIKADSSRQSIG